MSEEVSLSTQSVPPSPRRRSSDSDRGLIPHLPEDEQVNKSKEQRLIADILHGCKRRNTALETISALDELLEAKLEELVTR